MEEGSEFGDGERQVKELQHVLLQRASSGSTKCDTTSRGFSLLSEGREAVSRKENDACTAYMF